MHTRLSFIRKVIVIVLRDVNTIMNFAIIKKCNKAVEAYFNAGSHASIQMKTLRKILKNCAIPKISGMGHF
jgi:hypothetical protein